MTQPLNCREASLEEDQKNSEEVEERFCDEYEVKQNGRGRPPKVFNKTPEEVWNMIKVFLVEEIKAVEEETSTANKERNRVDTL